MGEIIKGIANTAGVSAFILGIWTNLGNFLSILLAAAGLGYAVYKALNEREDWLEKKHKRDQRNKKP